MQPAHEAMRCLLVEDDPSVIAAFELVLEHAGSLCVTAAGSEREALRCIDQSRPDIALLDLDIEGGSSLGVATLLLAKDVPLAFVSGYPQSDLPFPFDGLPFLHKPV